MTTKTEVKYRGIGFLPLLTLIFITLKLTGYITWSWWLVLLPMIVPLTILFICLLILGVCYYIAQKS